jgi:hypothetical protein
MFLIDSLGQRESGARFNRNLNAAFSLARFRGCGLLVFLLVATDVHANKCGLKLKTLTSL